MARVVRVPGGYEFIGLSLTGMRLVNEFQRHFPLLCAPSGIPDFRFIRCGSAEQNVELGKLIADVLERDPEPPKSQYF
jgi:hypothetical protein